MRPKRLGSSGTQAGALVGGGVFLAFLSLYVLPTYIQRSNHYESMYHDAIRVIGGLEQHGVHKKPEVVASGPVASRWAFQDDSKSKPNAVVTAQPEHRGASAEEQRFVERPVSALQSEMGTSSPMRLASAPASPDSVRRELPPFYSIEANGNTHFKFTETGTPGVQYRSASVRAEVVGGVLRLSGPSDTEIKVCGPNVARISLNGNANLSLEGTIDRQIHLDLSGACSARTRGKVSGLGANLSGNASLEIGGPTTDSVSAILNGSSTLASRGPVGQLSLRASNASHISLKNIECQSASINLGGDCELKADGRVGTLSISAGGQAKFACDKLTAGNAGLAAVENSRVSLGHVDVLSADAKGRGVIQCQGKPRSLSQHAEESGSIRLTSA